MMVVRAVVAGLDADKQGVRVRPTVAEQGQLVATAQVRVARQGDRW